MAVHLICNERVAGSTPVPGSIPPPSVPGESLCLSALHRMSVLYCERGSGTPQLPLWVIS